MPKPPIQLKRSGTASATPSSLEHGELALNYADSKVFWKNASNTISSFTFQAYALASHTHAASDITSGTFDAARLPLATTGAAGAVIVGTGLGVSSGTVSVTYGTTSGTACQGNDSRLSDARTPTSHSHGNITNAGAIGSTANLPIITTTSGVLTTGSFGTTAATFCEGNDARLSDTRTPTDGSVTTAKIANDAVTYAKLQNVSATDRLLGRASAGAGDVEEVTCTAFGRSLIDDADAAAARTTLSVQPTASPAFTGTVSAAAANFTGAVSVTSPLTLTGTVAGNVRALKLQTSGSDRWQITPGFDSESGSNAGSTFWITRWSDAGEFLGTPIAISRATGSVTLENPLFVPAGSASACGVAFSGDPDTGIAQLSAAGANTLSICTNSAERVRVNADGMVLCSSGFALQGEARPSSGAGLEVNYVSSINAATIGAYDRTGNTYKELHLFGSVIDFQIGAGSDMRLNADGRLLIGTTTDSGAYRLQVNSQIYATNATIATSDARFKTNVESLADATAVIEALRPVAFDFLPHAERNFATERQVGLIAQEAQEALAGCDYAASVVAQCGDHLGLAYEKLVPVLIRALQESNARIGALEERLNHA